MERQEREHKQFLRMTQTPIPKLISTLAVPTIISMMVTAVYNMADTFFVSQLGTSAAGAVGVVFSLMTIIQAIGFMIGMGSGSLISGLLGQRKQHQADVVASTGFYLSLVCGAVIMVLGLALMDPLMRLLGATPTILPYARDYAQYILYGAPFMCASFVLNNVLRAEGKATLAMVGISAGGILNIVLDPLFIFTFDMGIAGAAIATILSQFISFCMLLSCFLAKRSTLSLRPRNTSRHFDVYQNILTTGFPSFCRQGLASIATAVLNSKAGLYGDAAVAAMSIVNRIFMLVFSVMLGFGQGFQPVCGYNYGAKQYDRVKHAILFTLKTGIVLMTVLGIVGYLVAPQVISWFRREDAEVIAIGCYALRAQCLVLPLFPLCTVCNMTFQVLGKKIPATVLAAARQGLFFLPLILILPPLIGLRGVQLTQPLADVLTMLCSLLFFVPFMRELNGLIAQQQAPKEEAFAPAPHEAG